MKNMENKNFTSAQKKKHAFLFGCVIANVSNKQPKVYKNQPMEQDWKLKLEMASKPFFHPVKADNKKRNEYTTRNRNMINYS